MRNKVLPSKMHILTAPNIFLKAKSYNKSSQLSNSGKMGHFPEQTNAEIFSNVFVFFAQQLKHPSQDAHF